MRFRQNSRMLSSTNFCARIRAASSRIRPCCGLGADVARGALRIGTEQYEQGATDFTTVLTAEQNLFQAESNVATALPMSHSVQPLSTARSGADGRYGRTAIS
ncbi:TolC family protein [Bradyrhizobium neotropicale]|uniref:TolC family protein n=1 Tax=Bradyrhizobium neotropicale TaxID=1497615 RepID=UPI0032216564